MPVALDTRSPGCQWPWILEAPDTRGPGFIEGTDVLRTGFDIISIEKNNHYRRTLEGPQDFSFLSRNILETREFRAR